MTEELVSPMVQVENLERTQANEWLRITNNFKSSYPADDPGPGTGGAEIDPPECGGDPSTPSDPVAPIDPPDNTGGGDSYTPSD